MKNEVVPITDYMVTDEHGKPTPFLSKPTTGTGFFSDPEKLEYMVAVDWIKTLPLDQAIKEKGFFGNQHSVAAPKAPKWEHTVQRLKQRFGIA